MYYDKYNTQPPLITAVIGGCFDVINHLEETQHAYVTSKDCYGCTELLKASSNGYLEIFKYLCEGEKDLQNDYDNSK